jgi:alpha-1,6-mannosyltransferase
LKTSESSGEFIRLKRPALQRIVNEELPDLIEVSDKYSMPYLAGLLRTRRLPGVNHRPTAVGLSHERMDENMAAYISGGRHARRFCEWYMKWIYFPMFDHHITVSEHTASELIVASRGHKVRRGIWVAPMGVDCERFTPARRSQRVRDELVALTHAPVNATLLFYAGRLAPEKNPQLLIETAARLDPAHYRLAIAGDGILLGALKRQCEARGLRHVVFLGHVSDRDRLADYFANSDIFVHPNPREPFGITPLEAMASGSALVAPRAGGVTSYADDSNAWLAEPSPEAFAAAIAAAIGDPLALTSRTKAARVTAEKHRWPCVTDRYLKLCRELHAITRGEQISASIPPYRYSTPGDSMGRELITASR